MAFFEPFLRTSPTLSFVRCTVCVPGPLTGAIADSIKNDLSKPARSDAGAAVNKGKVARIRGFVARSSRTAAGGTSSLFNHAHRSHPTLLAALREQLEHDMPPVKPRVRLPPVPVPNPPPSSDSAHPSHHNPPPNSASSAAAAVAAAAACAVAAVPHPPQHPMPSTSHSVATHPPPTLPTTSPPPPPAAATHHPVQSTPSHHSHHHKQSPSLTHSAPPAHHLVHHTFPSPPLARHHHHVHQPPGSIPSRNPSPPLAHAHHLARLPPSPRPQKRRRKSQSSLNPPVTTAATQSTSPAIRAVALHTGLSPHPQYVPAAPVTPSSTALRHAAAMAAALVPPAILTGPWAQQLTTSQTFPSPRVTRSHLWPYLRHHVRGRVTARLFSIPSVSFSLDEWIVAGKKRAWAVNVHGVDASWTRFVANLGLVTPLRTPEAVIDPRALLESYGVRERVFAMVSNRAGEVGLVLDSRLNDVVGEPFRGRCLFSFVADAAYRVCAGSISALDTAVSVGGVVDHFPLRDPTDPNAFVVHGETDVTVESNAARLARCIAELRDVSATDLLPNHAEHRHVMQTGLAQQVDEVASNAPPPLQDVVPEVAMDADPVAAAAAAAAVAEEMGGAGGADTVAGGNNVGRRTSADAPHGSNSTGAVAGRGNGDTSGGAGGGGGATLSGSGSHDHGTGTDGSGNDMGEEGIRAPRPWVKGNFMSMLSEWELLCSVGEGRHGFSEAQTHTVRNLMCDEYWVMTRACIKVLQIVRREMSGRERWCMLPDALMRVINMVCGICDRLSEIEMMVEQSLGGQYGSMRQCMAEFVRGHSIRAEDAEGRTAVGAVVEGCLLNSLLGELYPVIQPFVEYMPKESYCMMALALDPRFGSLASLISLNKKLMQGCRLMFEKDLGNGDDGEAYDNRVRKCVLAMLERYDSEMMIPMMAAAGGSNKMGTGTSEESGGGGGGAGSGGSGGGGTGGGNGKMQDSEEGLFAETFAPSEDWKRRQQLETELRKFRSYKKNIARTAGAGESLRWWESNAELFPNIASLFRKVVSVPSSHVPVGRILGMDGVRTSVARRRLGRNGLEDVVLLHENLTGEMLAEILGEKVKGEGWEESAGAKWAVGGDVEELWQVAGEFFSSQ